MQEVVDQQVGLVVQEFLPEPPSESDVSPPIPSGFYKFSLPGDDNTLPAK